MTILSLYPERIFQKEELELPLGIRLSRSIEKTMVAKLDEGYIFWTKFGVITFVGFTRDQIIQQLRRLQLAHPDDFEQKVPYQDYALRIDPQLEKAFKINNDEIILKELSVSLLSIVALVLAQSVGLEKYERLLDRQLAKSKHLLEGFKTFSIAYRKKLVAFSTSLVSLRQELVIDLLLMDKPNIVWDDETAENAYNKLSTMLELKDRLSVVEYKLGLLKDDIGFMMDVINHKRSEFLEWIIIILIAFEIVMGLAKMIG